MSYFTDVMARIKTMSTNTTCPVCGKKSKQSITKLAKEQTMVCPHCKSLFVIH
ncbi:YnfU family zinc-binding protein [Pantoea sp. B65]|uniref:YnfU family zinc-binding protein n=1 Tax=Pantoea sp. B65 TaxID=2813359 RepID=UPI0039B5774C